MQQNCPMLQIQGYPNPPSDLPDSPSPSTKVGAPAGPQPPQKSPLTSSDGGTTKILAGPAPPAGPQPTSSPLSQQTSRLPVSSQAPPVAEGVTATMPLPQDLQLADETKSTGTPPSPLNKSSIPQQASQITYVPEDLPVRCCTIGAVGLPHA